MRWSVTVLGPSEGWEDLGEPSEDLGHVRG